MAKGQIHGRATTTLIPIAGLLGYLAFGSWFAALGMTLGCFLGYFVEPDLDVDIITESESRIRDRFHLLGMIWIAFWMPYAKAVPHRHPISHFPVIGTLFRWLYFLGISSVLVFVIGLIFGSMTLPIDLALMYWRPLGYVWLGNALSDYAHWMFDLS